MATAKSNPSVLDPNAPVTGIRRADQKVKVVIDGQEFKVSNTLEVFYKGNSDAAETKVFGYDKDTDVFSGLNNEKMGRPPGHEPKEGEDKHSLLTGASQPAATTSPATPKPATGLSSSGSPLKQSASMLPTPTPATPVQVPSVATPPAPNAPANPAPANPASANPAHVAPPSNPELPATTPNSGGQ